MLEQRTQTHWDWPRLKTRGNYIGEKCLGVCSFAHWPVTTSQGLGPTRGGGEELNCALNNSNHWLLTLAWIGVTRDRLLAQTQTWYHLFLAGFFISTDVLWVKSNITAQPPVVCWILAPIILPDRANEAAANIPRNNFCSCPQVGRGKAVIKCFMHI